MDDEVELVSDGDGLAVIGEPTAVERFMSATGLSNLESQPLGLALAIGASVAQVGADAAANSGRWLKLTAESAEKLKDMPLTPTKTPGVSHAMLGQRGSIKSWLQVENAGGKLRNPAMMSGAAGMMAQLAMQQTMAEITDYLAVIDQKLDDVMRAQTNQVLARLDGVDLAVREAMSVRASVGRVSEVTWPKVQSSAQTIHETQGYALRQIANLTDKLAASDKIHELVDTAKEIREDIQQVAARPGSLLRAARRCRRPRTRPCAGRLSGRDRPPSHRVAGRATGPGRTHLCEDGAALGSDGCRSRHGQFEGAVQSDAVAGRGPVEQPCRGPGS